MATGETKPICFVIAPIGDAESETRKRSDQVLNHIIRPAAADCGYETVRADQISEPGMITSQVIQHIMDAPLVVADLTGHNPNVFYELAIRHALKKPVVQIIQDGESLPFDIAPMRTIFVDHRDLDRAAKAKDEITKQIKSAVQNPEEVDTPISMAIELQNLRHSDNPLEKGFADIMLYLQSIHSDVSSIRNTSKPTFDMEAALGPIEAALFDIDSALDSAEAELDNNDEAESEIDFARDKLTDAQNHVTRLMRGEMLPLLPRNISFRSKLIG